jgi:hypothetical protein
VGHHGVGVQAGLANIVRMYLEHYADDEYRLIPRFGPEKVVLGIKEQFPERATAYFHYYGLDAARCFRHSLELIAGGLDAVLSVMVIH